MSNIVQCIKNTVQHLYTKRSDNGIYEHKSGYEGGRVALKNP